MAPKFSVLLTAIAVAAAVPPLLSYIPQTSSLFSVTDPSSTTQTSGLSAPQQVPYANSVNQLNDLTQRQNAELNGSAKSELKWKKAPANASSTIHHVGYAPIEQPQPAAYPPPEPVYSEQSVSTAGHGPVSILEPQSQSNVVYYSEVPGQVVQIPQGVEIVSGPVPQNVIVPQNVVIPQNVVVPQNAVVQRNMTGLEFWFRFDITPEWIEQNWDFVTASVGPMNLRGYSVSLVTGSSPDDLTGVLTYYFDNHKQLQQIQFQGTTGHLGRLTAMLRQQFHMSQRIVNDPSLTIFETPKSYRGPKNIMEARAPMVIKSDQLYHRFEIYLQLNRPVEKKGLLW